MLNSVNTHQNWALNVTGQIDDESAAARLNKQFHSRLRVTVTVVATEPGWGFQIVGTMKAKFFQVVLRH